MIKQKVFLVVLMSALLCGCDVKSPAAAVSEANVSASVMQSATEPDIMDGSDFLRTAVKVKGDASGRLSNGVSDAVKFELYIDAEGNGEGLAGHGSKLYQVSILNNELFFWLDGKTAVKITDVSGHLNSTEMPLTGVSDLSVVGFTLVNGSVTSYDGTSGDIHLTAKYAKTDHKVKKLAVPDIADVTFANLMEFIVNGQGIPELSGSQSDASEETQPSSHLGGVAAISMDGVKYNIGDYCNPADYYDNRVPSGLVPEYIKNGAQTAELLHVTWEGPGGTFEVTTMDGKVVSIYTTCEFKWIGFSNSSDYEDIRVKLGANLNYQEEQTWVPFNKNLVCTSANSGEIDCTYGNTTIVVEFDGDKHMSSYRADMQLPFLAKDSD